MMDWTGEGVRQVRAVLREATERLFLEDPSTFDRSVYVHELVLRRTVAEYAMCRKSFIQTKNVFWMSVFPANEIYRGKLFKHMWRIIR